MVRYQFKRIRFGRAVNEDNGNPVMKVGKDFELIPLDFVSNPSTHESLLIH